MEPDQPYSYDAFVSYSHEADGDFASKLVSAIRGYFGFRQASERLRVFRDTESLTAARGLTAELERHLAAAEHLILLASPQAASSPYVRAELAWWLANRDVARLVLVVTSGSIQPDAHGARLDAKASNALPPVLSESYAEVPLFIDCRRLRADESGWTLRYVAFADKVADVVAVLTRQTRDRVRGQRVEALRRESELLATRLLENSPEDPELFILLAVEAVRSFAPSARSVLALNHAIARSRLRGCFAGHGGPLTACRYLPDGERFVTASTDSTARLWSARTGEVLAVFGHDSPVLAVALSPDSRSLATALHDGSGRVWSLDSGTEVCRLIGHQRAVNSVAFSPDGQYVVTASEDRTARVWHSRTGQHVRTLHRRNREPRCAVFSPVDGPVVVTGAWGFRLLIWDVRNGKVERKLWGAFGPEVDVSPQGERIVTASDKSVRVWDLRKRSQGYAADLEGHTADVASVAFGPDGETIVSAAADRTVRIWRPGAPEPQVVPVLQGVASARLSPDGSCLLTACDDGSARLWELEPRHEEVSVGPVDYLHVTAVSGDGSRFVTDAPGEPYTLWEISGRKVGELGAHGGFPVAAAFSLDGTVIACTGADSAVSLWDAARVSPLASWPIDQGDVRGVEFSSDGSLLLTAGGDGTVHITSVADATDKTIVHVSPGRVETVRCSPGGKLFATIHGTFPDASFCTGVGIFSVATGRPVRLLDDHQNTVAAVAFSPDGSQLATACWDGRARIYDTATGALLRELNHEKRVECVCFSPDGTLLATTKQFEAEVQLWDAGSGEPVMRLLHRGWVSDSCFSPDGTTLLVLSRDVAYVWDLHETELINVLRGHAGWLRAGVFTADGRHIVTAADDGTVRVWSNPAVDELVSLAGTRTFRDLSAGERHAFGLPATGEEISSPTRSSVDDVAVTGVTRIAFPVL